MTVSSKQYYMYNTTAVVSLSATYFYYRYVNVSGTEKLRSTTKNMQQCKYSN